MKKLLLTIAALSASICVSHAQELQTRDNSIQDPTYLVKPNGQYSVGYHDVIWTNGTLNSSGQYKCPNNQNPYYTGQNKDDFSLNNQTDFCREVVLRIYYPTQKNNEIGNSYPPLLNFYSDLINTPDFPVTPEKRKELINALVLKSYAIANKDIVHDKKFPVVFFSPGFGANIEMYENSITNLVSHGYVVVGINNLFINGYTALENGHIVSVTTDYSIQTKLNMRVYLQKNGEFIYNKIVTDSQSTNKDKILNEIYSSMDLTKMGIYGHSIGGSMAGDMVLAHPSWFKAVSTLDGASDVKPTHPTRDVYPIPVLQQAAIFSRDECSKDPVGECDGDPDIYNLNSDGYLVVYQNNENPSEVNYFEHLNYLDLSTTKYEPSMVEYWNYYKSAPNELGTANGWESANNTNTYLLNFFDTYLKNNKVDPDFGLCEPLTKNSKLICGPASGV